MGDPLLSVRTTILEKLKKGKQLEKVSAAFGQLKTDKERVAYVLKLPCIQEEISIKPPSSQKSAGASVSLRNEGNTLFQKRQLSRALETYTQSILAAPSTDENISALAYANRSAVLIHMKEYELCLRDVELALGLNYPKEMRYKILDRKARSLVALGKRADAVAVFKEAIESIDESKLKKKDKETWCRQLEKQASECSSSSEKEQPKDPVSPLDKARSGFSPPVLSYGANEQFIVASKALDIKATQAKGRYPVAARDINIGDVVLIEKPYASVLLREQSKSHCHHCLVYVVAPLPCAHCADVRYCSTKCAQESWDSYHSVECKNLEHIYVAGKYGHLALRVIVKTGYERLNKTVSKLETEAARMDESHLGCNASGIYEPSDYRAIYHLVTHSQDRSVNDLFTRTINAIYLLKCIDGSFFGVGAGIKDQEKSPTRDQQAFIGGLLLRHLQSLPCNAHEISELQLSLKSVATSEAVEVGAGIYATLSLFNHSCDPNVTRFFYGDKCVVRAFRSIPAGGEVEDNYGILSALTPRQQRQDTLQSQYYFKCECHACSDDSPLYAEVIKKETPSLKCSNCKVALAGLMKEGRKLVICDNCGTTEDIELKANFLQQSEVAYSEAMTQLLGEADVASALPKLVMHLLVLEGLVCEPWQGYNSTQELMKQGYNILANCHLVD